MKQTTINLWEKEEYQYPVVGEFLPTLTSYVHEDGEVHPAFVVVPGGGYRMVSVTEGELVAKKFYDKGFNAFVVTYTTCLPGPEPLRLQPLKDLSKAIVYLRKHKEVYDIDEHRVTICGFSAGAHLCGTLAVHYEEPQIQLGGEYAGISNRPDTVVLSYPVITTGEYAHRDSFVALLGADATKGELEYMSLELQVKEGIPPVFLWQTVTDETVPVENSYLFAESCKKAGVPYEHHVFHKGMHGLSLANEDWASGSFEGIYCMKQMTEYISYCIEHDITPVEPFSGLGMLPKGTDVGAVYAQGVKQYCNYQAEPCVQVWPELVENWLSDLWTNR